MKLIDKLWLWGQSAGSHHAAGNPFMLPGTNYMTPSEGAKYFGIKNMCRVVMANMPSLPFDKEADELDEFDNVVWSIIGSGGSEHISVVDEILRLAKNHKNIIGGVMDDFMTETRMQIFSPMMVREYREKLNGFSDRELALWSVIYTQELTEERRPYINECDVVTMWTWWANFIPSLEENLSKLRGLSNGQKIYAGCYLYDYGNRAEISDEMMELQLDTYYRWLKEGKIEGMILCSNCVADLGFNTTNIAKNWIDKHKDEEI